ncbi:LysE family translocator [Candidatus Finniella inopinata]|uniref:LysE family translocator n=1 Tax=Candidatus Finniella inopinata TaxID=1696036 RepID=A0A4Q7DJS0_9PROT|nr:LysE family translocator [Candidatus Finniella inopinata]RZI46519.1 LysE family translocator [Candidatus Finniella inopinata]
MDVLSVYFLQWLALISILSLAVMSPGPDFVVVIQNSIVHSRRTGIWVSLGLGFGVLVHVTYTIAGLAAVISESIFLFNTIKWAGAAYLIYIGCRALQSKGAGASVDCDITTEKTTKGISDLKALRLGFFTNVLNPKASLFFLVIFSQLIQPQTPVGWKITYGLTCCAITIGWFSILAYALTQRRIRSLFLGATKWIDRVCGGLMIALGIKVAFMAK